MIDYVRFYDADKNNNGNNFICKVSINGKEKRIFNKDKLVIENIIRRYGLIPDISSDNYVEYRAEDFASVESNDLMAIKDIYVSSSEIRKVNRDKSKKIRAQVLGISSAIVLALAGYSYKTINDYGKDIEINPGTLKSTGAYTVIDSTFIPDNDNIELLDTDNDIELLNTDDDIELLDTDSYDSNDYTFCFNYQDRSKNDEIINSSRYDNIYVKYDNMYGIDHRLLAAIGAQEHSGVHSEVSQNGYAVGLMQIETTVWNGKELSAFNFDTNSYENIIVDANKLSDVDYNIKVASMILQTYLRQYNYNLPIALQAYNIGSGNMDKVLYECSINTGFSRDEMLNNPSNNEWLNYINVAVGGDKEYLNHVLSFLGNDTNLSITKADGTIHHTTLINENANDYVNVVSSIN